MSRLCVILLAGAALLGCYQDDSTGTLNRKPMARVLLTDAPFPFDTVQSVDIYVINVSVSTQADTGNDADNMSWVTVTEPHRKINLLTLQQGDTALMGSGEVDAAQYKAVRLIIDTDSSEIRFTDGTAALVHWGGAGRQAIHAFVEGAVNVPEGGASIVIDFDVGRSFHYNDFGDGGFNFLPWIRAVNLAATGSIFGTISGDASAPGPVIGATISASGGGPGNWQIYSTGVTDGSGHYRLAYLPPGTYIVQIDPPSGSSLGSDLDSTVTVVVGGETEHSPTLGVFNGSLLIQGATSMLNGATKELIAWVINAQHEQDTLAPVTWQNLDTAVFSLVPNGRRADVTAKKVGNGRIAASSGSLADTVRIFVAADSGQ